MLAFDMTNQKKLELKKKTDEVKEAEKQFVMMDRAAKDIADLYAAYKINVRQYAVTIL